MSNPSKLTLQCPHCGQPINAIIETVVDATDDPQAKERVLSGRVNMVQCPHCGTRSTVAAPLLYHDAGAELLISFVPMQLGLSKDAEEKAIGDLIRSLTNQLPQEARKGYLFQPRKALTMQGLVDQILQADGVSPEELEAQRTLVQLVERFIQAGEAALPAMVAEHDGRIDGEFFQTMTFIAQRLSGEGRGDAARQIAQVQERIAELSSFGQEMTARSRVQEQVVAEVAAELNALGERPQRRDFLHLALRYVDADDHFEALVGLARPQFDYVFFQELTAKIERAAAAERGRLETVRRRLLELTAMIDQQQQMAAQQAVQLIQGIASSPNPDDYIRANLPLIDDFFMSVLAANVEELARRGDDESAANLRQIYEQVVAVLQENMQPELRFINELLAAGSEDEMRGMIDARAGEFDGQIFEVMNAVEHVLEAHGDDATLERLDVVRRVFAAQFG